MTAYQDRVQYRQELQRTGGWTDFVRRREALKAQGVPASQAWSDAYYATITAPPSGKKFDYRNEIVKGQIRVTDPPPPDCPNYDELMRAVAGKQASELQVFRFAFNYVDVPWDQLTADLIPSAGALALLKRVKSSEGSYRDFLGKFSKILPTSNAVEKASRHTDDGRAVFNLLDQAEKELAELPQDVS